MSSDRIAIVGIGLAYPDANSPDELWENVVASRRAFRDIPDTRTNLNDYWDADPSASDQFYSRKAAVLADYEFDRVRHRVSAGTFRATDLTHWLALDIAGRALADAGFTDGDGLPSTSTGVVIGNTLTGEFTRANLMRLRWPYVRRAVAAQLRSRDWSAEEIDEFVAELEPQYKAPFPEPSEDTLAGGLANTIAGRVCNYFDLGGGGYTVDGACSSSLLSVVNGASSLSEGDLDVVIAGGVDLSIDPFELVGFARTGALATGEMKVYDAGSNGFWPGEGCGMLVLMREADAVAQGKRIYACISGWGVSSDGKGGITRPEESGHRRALSRAYSRAGYSADTVSYFEGHGTGTAVGDETEIRALAGTREGSARAVPAALSSIKANIGHTKAAAGVAGLIKAALSVHHKVIPPVTGQVKEHPALAQAAGRIYTPTEVTPWPEDFPIRAGVSAMGFGGINTHIALEQADLTDVSRPVPSRRLKKLSQGRQDAEVILLGAADRAGLEEQARRTRERLIGAAMHELGDIAQSTGLASGKAFRAGVMASSVEQAVTRLDKVLERLQEAAGSPEDELKPLEKLGPGAFIGRRLGTPRVGFVFPGQGAGTGRRAALHRRFDLAPTVDEQVSDDTRDLQPRVVARSLEVLDLLQECGIEAQSAAGHSLGEITALAWAGALTSDQAVEIAAERGECMSRMSPSDGAMATVQADSKVTASLIDGTQATISGFNAPAITVVAGRRADIEQVCKSAAEQSISASPLAVDHAFHTEDFREAATAFRGVLANYAFQPLTKTTISTATGRRLGSQTDWSQHLAAQMVHPVRFTEAVAEMHQCDLVIEVGPGRALNGLVASCLPDTVATRTDSDSDSLQPFLETIAAAHCAGCDLDPTTLSNGRLLRPIDLDHRPDFLSNACEGAPMLGFVPSEAAPDQDQGQAADHDGQQETASTIDTVRRLISEKVELPLEMVTESTKPLDELHMSSITIGQVANDVVRALGRPALSGVPSFATASVREIATMLDDAFESEDTDAITDHSEAPGAAPWVRPFQMQEVLAPLTATPSEAGTSTWTAISNLDSTAGLRALRQLNGTDGLLLDVRADPDAVIGHLGSLLEWVQTARDTGTPMRLAILQGSHRGASGLAKTIHLEHPEVPVTLITLPDDNPVDEATAQKIAVEVQVNRGFSESTYSSTGERTVPRLVAVTTDHHDTPLEPGDVVLAIGGGKGITAEACLEIGRRYGASIALIGRSPADHDDIAATLTRFREAQIPHHYIQTDVLNPDDVTTAITDLQSQLGPITAVLHGAGVNQPKAALALTHEDFTTALQPKVDGLANVLTAIPTDQLKLVVGFASIIGRGGLFGEGHYALANDWLTSDLEQFAAANPHVRVRSLEWSVWAGAGMGENLGVVERLKQQGIEAIGAVSGLEELIRAISSPDFPVTTVICARTGNLPTLQFRPQELPLSRYLERTLVHYPAVELITEATLSPQTDLYLNDHELAGDLLLPAVLGMEAMTQVARALLNNTSDNLTFSDVVFERPIVVPTDSGETVRICAVAGNDGTVQLVIRVKETDFAADHFRATIRFGEEPHHRTLGPLVDPSPELPALRLDPHTELYGSVMFQGDRFQKICSYQRATARSATVEIDPSCRGDWFTNHLPQELILGDPGARDALMHSLQCCVPNAVLLPHSIERIDIALDGRTGPMVMDAKEREGDGEWFVYDISLRDKAGQIVEEWTGLRLRAVSRRDSREIDWTSAFLSSYLERQAEHLLGGRRSVIVEPHGDQTVESIQQRRAVTTTAARRASRTEFDLSYRSDGRPEASDGSQVSSSHGDGMTVAVLSQSTTAVDVESVLHKSVQDWRDLLGEQAFATAEQVSSEAREDLDSSATRVWGALECLRKVGHLSPAVHLGSVQDDGWVRFNVGGHRIATWVGHTQQGASVSFAILNGG